MTSAIDPIALAQALVRRPSVTPAYEGAMDVLASALKGIGFDVWRMTFGEAPDGPAENLFARRGTKGPHLAFAGPTDVVPPGLAWTREPFAGEIAAAVLHGRGPGTLKGTLDAFAPAAHPGGGPDSARRFVHN